MTMTENYRQAAGCILLHIDGKDNPRILLLRRSIEETSMHGLWELPGGKMEGKETPTECALQELLEETGLEPDRVIRTMPPHIDDNMEKIYHGIMGRIRGKEPTVTLSNEHDKYKWITAQDALDMDEPLSHHAEYLFKIWKCLE
jgi:8-oxo-dGTP pyrophosphatase MutT (NUDIX family)